MNLWVTSFCKWSTKGWLRIFDNTPLVWIQHDCLIQMVCLLISYKSEWHEQQHFTANICVLTTYNGIQLIFLLSQFFPHNQWFAKAMIFVLWSLWCQIVISMTTSSLIHRTLGQKSNFLYFCIQGNVPCIQGNLLCNCRTGLNFLYCRKFSPVLYLQSKFPCTHGTFPCTQKYRKFNIWPSVLQLGGMIYWTLPVVWPWLHTSIPDFLSQWPKFPVGLPNWIS